MRRRRDLAPHSDDDDVGLLVVDGRCLFTVDLLHKCIVIPFIFLALARFIPPDVYVETVQHVAYYFESMSTIRRPTSSNVSRYHA
jgi:hypothetical protein